MGCDAFNVGAYDLSLGVDYLVHKRAEAKFIFISANLSDKHGKLLLSPYLIKQVGPVKIGVFGLMDSSLKIDKVPENHKIMVKDPFEVARALVPEMKKKGADLIVLLTDMTSRSLRRVAQLGVPIDLIVGSDEKNEISLPIVVENTFITHLDRGGKAVGRLEIAFPGGSASDAGSRSLPGLSERLKGLSYQNNFVQLRLSIPDHLKIGPMVAAVTDKISEIQKDSMSVADGSGDSDCGKRFVGVEICAGCHPGRHKAWLATEHSRAYQTLVRKNKQYDDDCIVCHSLAYQCALGEPDMKNIGAFANVQCESCHGPGELHVKTRGKETMTVAKSATSTCLRCHTPEKSADSGFLGKFRSICTETP